MEIFELKKHAIGILVAGELDILQEQLTAHYDTQLQDVLNVNQQLRAQITNESWPAPRCHPQMSQMRSGSLPPPPDVTDEKQGLLVSLPRSHPPLSPCEQVVRLTLAKVGLPKAQLEVEVPPKEDDEISNTTEVTEASDFQEPSLIRWKTLVQIMQDRKEAAGNVVLELRSTWVTVVDQQEKKKQVGGIHTLLKKAIIRGDCQDGGTREFGLKPSGSIGKDLARLSMSADELRALHAGELVLDEEACLQQCVYHPDQKVALCRMVIGTMLIMYDIVMFPMLAFDFKGDNKFDVMQWLTCVFWTIDIPLSFLQGFYKRGAVEMRPRKIAVAYLRSWLIPDVTLVSIDWTLLVTGLIWASDTTAQAGEEAGAIRFIRSFRSTRIFRVLRSLRFLKVFGVAADILSSMMSETLIIIARLALLIVAMLLICHYIACGWYGLAMIYKDEHNTWVKEYNLEGEATVSKYAASLHWSLTQFTPATNNLSPANPAERLFAVFIVIFALVMFSNFVSSITNATMEIRKIHYDRHTEESQIRNFLSVKGVPLDVSNRIWHFYKRHYRAKRSGAYEGDIHFFGVIPTSLGASLHRHIYLPTLRSHCVFKLFSCADEESLLSVAKVAISEKYVLHGGEIFNPGDPGSNMIFGKSGSLLYDCALYSKVHSIPSPSWVSEAALWAKWVHCGQLTVANSAELMFLDAWKLELVMHQRASDISTLRCLRTYAALFAQFVSDNADMGRPITDILGDGFDRKIQRIQEMAYRSFNSNEDEQIAIVKKVQQDQAANMFNSLFSALRKPQGALKGMRRSVAGMNSMRHNGRLSFSGGRFSFRQSGPGMPNIRRMNSSEACDSASPAMDGTASISTVRSWMLNRSARLG